MVITSELCVFWKVCVCEYKAIVIESTKIEHFSIFLRGNIGSINIGSRTSSLFATINNKSHPLKSIIFVCGQQRASWTPVEKMHHPLKNIIFVCSQQLTSIINPVAYILLE